MAGDEVDSLSFQLGGIKSSLDMIMRTLSEDREASARYRTDIRKEIAEAKQATATVEKDMILVKNDLAEIKPKVAALDQNRMQSAGVSNFIVVIGKFAHAMSALIGGGVALLIERWLNSPK